MEKWIDEWRRMGAFRNKDDATLTDVWGRKA